jgi:pyridoxal phosphate enzyme (YggS family)
MSEPPREQVGERLREVRARVAEAARRAGRSPGSVRVVAVSKTATPAQVLGAYAAGQREFGESRVQDALPKLDLLPEDVVWHLVGHLQSNKVNKVLGRFDLIHSVDGRELAERLSEKSLQRELLTPVLLQVNCSGEESKHGVAPGEAEALALALQELRGIVVKGLMTMAPLAGGAEAARASFRQLATLRDALQRRDLPRLPVDELSMGMSGDYEIAVEEGATILRVGTAIFGAPPVDA